MRHVRISVALFTLALILFIVGCTENPDSNKPIISSPNKIETSGGNESIEITKLVIASPDKIIIYSGSKSKEITSKEREFERIVNLTNSRFEVKELSVVKDGVDINGQVNQKKKTVVAVEFIYNNEQVLDIANNNGFAPIRYQRLFFELRDDLSSVKPGGTGNTIFQYGDKDFYKDSSRGPIKGSAELTQLVDSKIKQ